MDHNGVTYLWCVVTRAGLQAGGFARNVNRAAAQHHQYLPFNVEMCHAEFAHVPVGKQRRHPQRHPSSIWYTSSSGIWQTVWLEPVTHCPNVLLTHTLCLLPFSICPAEMDSYEHLLHLACQHCMKTCDAKCS